LQTENILGFGLREGFQAWVVVAAGVLGAGALAPVAVPVAVGVDAEAGPLALGAGGDVGGALQRARFAPQPVLGVRVLVAVGVHHRHHVEVHLVQQPRVLLQFVHHVGRHRRRDPLARVHTLRKNLTDKKLILRVEIFIDCIFVSSFLQLKITVK
jgi:hypothetical protein